jgi:hypothetical protein
VSEPGWCEIDTMTHCGASSGGDFACSVNLTDIATGWTETRAVQGKGQLAVLAAIDEMRSALPFALLGLDSDSGSEFINGHCSQWCAKHGVAFTRSRPYRKNDNAHIEQKNFTHVRKVLGWQRLGGDRTVAAMNELYRSDLRLLMNLFQPSVKLVERIRTGSRVRRSYDAAATPLDRLHALRPDLAAKLVARRNELDPISLSESIDAQVAAILAHESPPIVKAAYRGPPLRALSARHVRDTRLAEGVPVRSHVAR